VIEDTLATSEQGYRQRFQDPSFGADLAEVIAERCGLPRPLERKVEGSNLLFRAGEGPWLKICPPFWTDAFEAEVRVTEAVQGRLPVPVPSIVETGGLQNWRYLISDHVPGVQFQDARARLTNTDFDNIADELGQFAGALHAIEIPGFERSFGPWTFYLDERLTGARGLHLARGVDPARVGQIEALLADLEPWIRGLVPVLIHADLTDEHVMLAEQNGQWRLSGVLDLADAMNGPAPLDLVLPCIELFRGRRGPQRRLMDQAGVVIDGGPFSVAAMAVALLHPFIHFDHWFAGEIAAGAIDVWEIARLVFPD
jgi:hygromycin-B 7''-O-kinase